MSEHSNSPFSGLDLLSSSVILLDEKLSIRYLNSAAEDLLAISGKTVAGAKFCDVTGCPATLLEALDNALQHGWGHSGQNIEIQRNDELRLQLNCTVNRIDAGDVRLLVELWPIDQQIKATREERLLEQQLANRELIRNLAHEIKNPLGGIRGAAQLLEHELNNPALREYTQVIIKETDRLQAIADTFSALAPGSVEAGADSLVIHGGTQLQRARNSSPGTLTCTRAPATGPGPALRTTASTSP